MKEMQKQADAMSVEFSCMYLCVDETEDDE